MSRCSKKCNELRDKIKRISGLDDDFVYKKLLEIELIIGEIGKYADEDILNGSCFKGTTLGEIMREELGNGRRSNSHAKRNR